MLQVEYFNMPTPFQHLFFAVNLLSHQDLPESLHIRLSPRTGAFLLGNTAPDIQTLTHKTRMSTHFYRIRDYLPLWGWENMLIKHPGLANPYNINSNQASFISGYLVHLLWDEIWTRYIYSPFYMNAPFWPDRKTYILHHNALRVIMDRKAHSELRAHKQIMNLLTNVQPDAWLPFADDSILEQWRNWLGEQLQDGGESHTVQVFADRMNVSTSQFLDVINTLERNKGVGIPGLSKTLKKARNQALIESVDLLLHYWQINKTSKDTRNKGPVYKRLKV